MKGSKMANAVKIASVEITADEMDMILSALSTYEAQIRRAIQKERDGQIIALRNAYVAKVAQLGNKIGSKELV